MRWLWLMTATTLVGTTLGVACRGVAVSDKPLPSGTMKATGASSKCKVSIATSALEGCRAPNEPGCEFCYASNSNGTCTILSGHARDGDLWVYTSASRETDCPAAGPRCARCMRNSEAILCEEPQRPECDCQIDPGIDPCIAPSSCACYCSAYNLARTACPSPG